MWNQKETLRESRPAVRKPLPFEVCFTDRELYTGICKYLRSGDLSDNCLYLYNLLDKKVYTIKICGIV